MSTGTHVTGVLNGMLEGVGSVIQSEITRENPTLLTSPISQQEMGVLIGMSGDVKGRLIIDGAGEVFGALGQSMYGMPLEGEMLESFVGELGNMIAGNMCTHISNQGIIVDITPPTVITGSAVFHGFKKALSVGIHADGVGSLRTILALENV